MVPLWHQAGVTMLQRQQNIFALQPTGPSRAGSGYCVISREEFNAAWLRDSGSVVAELT